MRALGTGVITGAADDDPAAIGTYASAGAAFGPAILWAAPVMFPMMAVTLYLAAKIGKVTGMGLAAVLRVHYPRWLLLTVAGVLLLGNTIEAAADLGGLVAGLHLLAPFPTAAGIVAVAALILAVQIFGSYTWIRNVFRWLALALLAYVGAAVLAQPNWSEIARATLLPNFHWTRDSLGAVVAIIGTTGSSYLFGWQASQQVEEEISLGRRRLSDRKDTTKVELTAMAWDVALGMLFSAVIMFFILLSTATTIFPVRWGEIHTAAEAAEALAPLAGRAAGALFAVGIIAVGFLAIPVMSVGAAYIVCDAMGWKSGLSASRHEAPQFHWVIVGVTVVAVAINFLGVNPIRALILAGLVQGFLAPGMIVLLLLITANPRVMGRWTNSLPVAALGWVSAAATAAAAVALVVLVIF
ncbi:MAG: NRAMP family divalent metal transporter [Terriglobales bacterium]